MNSCELSTQSWILIIQVIINVITTGGLVYFAFRQYLLSKEMKIFGRLQANLTSTKELLSTITEVENIRIGSPSSKDKIGEMIDTLYKRSTEALLFLPRDIFDMVTECTNLGAELLRKHMDLTYLNTEQDEKKENLKSFISIKSNLTNSKTALIIKIREYFQLK